MTRRRAVSMIEALVAVAVLAVTMAALMTFARQETKGIGLSEERTLALAFLAELREAFGYRGLEFYERSGFPDRFEAFSALQRTILEDHPVLSPPPDAPGRSPPVVASLARQAADLGVERAILFRPFVDANDRPAGEVRFVIRYRTRAGQPREVSTTRIVY